MRLLFILSIFLFYSCQSKKKDNTNEPVAGIYTIDSNKKVSIELRADSTLKLSLSGTKVQQLAKIADVNREGRYSIANDSIYIKWSNGQREKCAFKRQKSEYSFRIGSTTYRRAL